MLRFDAGACNREGPQGYICTLPAHHDGPHQAFGAEDEPPCEVWASTPRATPPETQGRFPHVCPGHGCAICAWVLTHPGEP